MYRDLHFSRQNAPPMVTVAIPTYNRAGTFLPQALSSALGQTYRNIEVIVSDNCSSDNTREFMEGIKDPRVRYFRHETNIGANANFNFCLEKGSGKYFQLLQDDDTTDPDFIETCMAAAAEKGYETGIIRTGTRLIDGEGRVEAELPNRSSGVRMEDLFIDWFEGRTSLYLCSTLFCTQRLREIGGFNSPRNLFQDVVAEFRLASDCGRVDVAEIKASFRKHSGELTFAAKVRDWCEDSVELIKLINDLSEYEKEEIRQQALRFFSMVNYNRARKITSALRRFPVLLSVYRQFGFTCPPPFYAFLPLEGPLAKKILSLKRKMKRILLA